VERQQLVGQLVERKLLERQQLVGELVERRQLVVGELELSSTETWSNKPQGTVAADGGKGVNTARRVAPIWIYNAALVAAAVVVWTGILHSSAAAIVRTPVPWWAYAFLFFLAEAYVVHIQLRREAHTISLSEVGLVLGLYVLSPAGLLGAALAGAVGALVLVRRQRAAKLVFNVAQLALTTAVAFVVFRAFVQTGDPFGPAGWGGVTLGVVAASLAGGILVTVAIAIAEGSIDPRKLPVPVAISVLSAVAVSNIALVAITLLRAERLSIVLLVLPAAIVVTAFREYVAQARRQEHLEFLYESMKATQGAPEFALAVNQLLIAARQLVRADYAEILLFPTVGQPGLRSILGPPGASTAHLEALDSGDIEVQKALDESVGAVLLAAGRPPHPLDGYLAVRHLADGMISALRGENGPFGLLVVGERSGDVATFSGDDRRLLDTFVGHASMMLENGRLERSLAELTDLKEHLRHQAFHDVLTGLPNRALFIERVEAALAHGSGTAAVLFLDLDDFKAINDTLGHAVGDEVLCDVGRRVARCIRGGDTAARLGGDEFAVLLDSIDRRGAEVVAESLLKAIRRPFQLPGREAAINASIGIAPASSAGTADELLRNADVAMYHAKESGKHRFAHYEPSMHAKVKLRHEFALGLRKALERNEIGVVFEPIVDLRHGRIVAFEALARWHSAERGVVMPGDFLPVAEDIGVMGQIGQRVLKLACREARAWQEAYPGFRDVGVSVNLSPSELSAESLGDTVARALFESRLPAEHLRIEITEHDVMRDLESAHRGMEELRALGAKLVLDDFGTGISSLERLDTFPLDALKIAKPFIDRLLDPTAESSFIDTFVRLASALGVECIAEGVEQPAQVARLLERGCTFGQGYHFAMPMPPDQLERYLADASDSPRLAGAI
jgi:diguanylate cyclase (GGDEF)-like protein